MNKNNESFEKVFDSLLTDAAIIANEKIGRELKDPVEDIKFSERHEKMMEKLFRKVERQYRRKKVIKYAQRCACVFVATAVVASVSVMSVDAWRVKFLNFVMEVEEPNTDYNFSDGTEGEVYESVSIGYIPEGFKLINSKTNESNIFLRFAKDSLYFTIKINSIDNLSSIDTENGSVEKIEIKGQEAVYTENSNINGVIWHDDMHAYTVYGNLTKNDLIRISENVEY